MTGLRVMPEKRMARTAPLAFLYVALLSGALGAAILTERVEALIALLLTAAALYWLPRSCERLTPILQAAKLGNPIPTGAVVVLAALFPLWAQSDPYLLHLAALACVYIVLAMGLNVTLGFVGQLDLGFMAYACIGAYTSAILSMRLHFPFWCALPAAAMLAAGAGLVVSLPAARVRGHYLALVTLGFGQVIYLLAKNLKGLTGGANGIRPIPPPTLGTYTFTDSPTLAGREFPFGVNYYYLGLVAVCATVFACHRLSISRLGRIWASIRDDELAASTFGVNVGTAKAKAFAISAFIGGAGGSVYAHFIQFVEPEDFRFFKSVMIVCMVILGGRGHIARIIVAALLLTILPERFRTFYDLRLLAFGSAMLAIALLSPRSVVAVEARKVRE